jgi:putative intracellular protease/amidase
MEDQELLSHLRRLASDARYVTSVCTGSLVLGAAGLLKGSAPRRTGRGGMRSRRSARSPIRRASCATATSSPAAASPRASTSR